MIVINKLKNGVEGAFSNEEWRILKNALNSHSLILEKTTKDLILTKVLINDINNQEQDFIE